VYYLYIKKADVSRWQWTLMTAGKNDRSEANLYRDFLEALPSKGFRDLSVIVLLIFEDQHETQAR
ncbi:MAG: hypothetical protein ACKPE3_38685, partial [Sphaerospermopsis kisseleviana]